MCMYVYVCVFMYVYAWPDSRCPFDSPIPKSEDLLSTCFCFLGILPSCLSVQFARPDSVMRTLWL